MPEVLSALETGRRGLKPRFLSRVDTNAGGTASSLSAGWKLCGSSIIWRHATIRKSKKVSIRTMPVAYPARMSVDLPRMERIWHDAERAGEFLGLSGRKLEGRVENRAKIDFRPQKTACAHSWHPRCQLLEGHLAQAPQESRPRHAAVATVLCGVAQRLRGLKATRDFTYRL
jgi:hypothetical protein